ncbi:MAG: hypothetical protein Q8J84_09580 [Flavobacteriaceae bacterium]|nr:hypothetical protein [Flavobacteriaceae bacterium]
MKQIYFKNESRTSLEPSRETIQFLLNYSKGLRTIKTVKNQVFFFHLN